MNSFKLSGKMGDCIWSLPLIKEYGSADIFYLAENEKDQFANKEIEFIKPLLEYQSYIKKIDYWKGESVKYDLDDFHYPLANFKLNVMSSFFKLFFKAVPSEYETEPWLECPDVTPTNNIIVNYKMYEMTNREKKLIPHKFYIDLLTNGLEKMGLFVGTEEEHYYFNKNYQCQIPRKEVKNALELACLIKGANMCVGNQSMATTMAESLKKTIFLETHKGENAHKFVRPNLFYLN